MVDEYMVLSKQSPAAYLVQIPLWSMNTHLFFHVIFLLSKFRFLYGRWILCCSRRYKHICPRSDSSMVDEYGTVGLSGELLERVQIPLWSMNTVDTLLAPFVRVEFRFLYGRWIPVFNVNTAKVSEFRFLYGRWILSYMFPPHSPVTRSDSSMVDEYLCKAS